MEPGEHAELVRCLSVAFGGADDVTPAGVTVPHIVLSRLELPDPWKPSPTRALTIWENWPATQPQFYIDEKVVGEGGQPPRNPSSHYLLGQTWRGFSFGFAWAGHDPVLAVQRWLSRFTVERT
jgi:hypothetical protein